MACLSCTTFWVTLYQIFINWFHLIVSPICLIGIKVVSPPSLKLAKSSWKVYKERPLLNRLNMAEHWNLAQTLAYVCRIQWILNLIKLYTIYSVNVNFVTQGQIIKKLTSTPSNILWRNTETPGILVICQTNVVLSTCKENKTDFYFKYMLYLNHTWCFVLYFKRFLLKYIMS